MKTYLLLQSQLGVLIHSMQHPESTQYNLPNYMFIPLSMTMERVASATRTLLQSVPELHTRFVAGEQGEVRQWCDMSMPIPVVTRKCSEAELQAYISDGFVRPFSLFSGEPLFRVEVIETEKRICLLSDGHHSIVDGMSFAPVLTTAFARIMEGECLEPEPYTMYQAAEDEAASFGTPLYQRARDYYARKFAGLEMATLSRSQYGTMGRMGRRTAVVSRRACDDWCSEHGVQPNLLFQAAFSQVISVLTRQQRVAYSTVNHGRLDLDAIRRFLIDHRITGGGYATPIVKLLLDKYDDLPMRFIAPGGEKLTSVYSDHMTIINCYGPTECTCGTSYYKIAPGIRLDDAPIGRPVANCYYFIVDSHGRLLPRGAEGELCIAGIQVGNGYWHRPELTAEKFCDCPFVTENVNGTPVRMYHTGDLCRWIASPHSAPGSEIASPHSDLWSENADGQMEYIGRIDNQVKLRGYRIELGEIEACASRFEGISQAVAVIMTLSGIESLCLYYTTEPGAPDVDADLLKQYLGNALPDYMVPTVYTQLDALPLTPNGKVDRSHLPEPSVTSALEALPPRTKKESVVLLMAQQVLGREDFGITDDLFDLGLTSIAAIKVATMSGACGIRISVNNLMRLRTIERLFAAETPVGYWYNTYSPEKPVLVVPHGVVPAISMSEKFYEWQDHFSIYTLESTEEHTARLAPDNDYERLVDAYARYLYRDIPEDARMFGFLGYSWGGEVSYSLATRWQQKRGGQPHVYLCDTFIFEADAPKMTEEQITQALVQYLMTHAGDFDTSALGLQPQQATAGDNNIFSMAIMKCSKDFNFAGEVMKIITKKFLSAEIYRRIQPLPAYDGHVAYFVCTRENPKLAENLAGWRKLAPEMEVVSIDDNHMNFAIRNDKTYLVTEKLLADLNRWRENGEQ